MSFKQACRMWGNRVVSNIVQGYRLGASDPLTNDPLDLPPAQPEKWVAVLNLLTINILQIQITFAIIAIMIFLLPLESILLVFLTSLRRVMSRMPILMICIKR